MATLGIDLGGTFARAAVVDEAGRILAASRAALGERSPPAVVECIGRAAEEALRLAGVPVRAVGVGAAAQIPSEGRIAVAPNLGWRDVPLGALLQARLGRPVRLVNDLSAAAWGELRVGAGRGAQDLLVVFVGSGVGSAIVANGQLLQGANGVGAELGHVKAVPGGRACGCGEKGCLEAYAGGHHLVAQARELLQRGASPALARLCAEDPARLTPVHLEQAAREGDAEATRVHAQAAHLLALAVANQVTVLNPARLILGGGVLTHCPGLRERVLQGVQDWSGRTAREGLLVLDAELGDDSGLIGAALLA
ncbi:ROK family protein [Aggregicoccus sp. 17bor-14]|uniref:ROK family protein n=1 Tax=Myxococcaceae TaxID=31 RepID=UPI00129D0155|nr:MULTISPECIES: ROK family protein [Myxococcaceae]MBF5046173.1 ROK family protein [Simulacricoccus sp. 17bor-14]MRI91898.1 ROK family protein [Aggregicoccus sp. 17bor-14]